MAVTYTTRAGEQRPLSYPAPAALVEHCTRVQGGTAIGVGTRNADDIAALIRWMTDRGMFEPDESWYQIGMALRLEFGDAVGLPLWRITHRDPSHPKAPTPSVEQSRWNSFATEPIPGVKTLNSFMKDAHAAGWTGSIRPSLDHMFPGLGAAVTQIAADAGATLSIDGNEFHCPEPSAQPVPPGAPLVPQGNVVQSSAEFIASFVPPEYLLHGILQRQYIYSLTAMTGAGKTAFGLLLAAHIALGRNLGDREVERGSVLYFAAENHVDVQARWIAMAEHHGFSADDVDVHFVPGSTKLSTIAERITQEINASGRQFGLVVIDTSAATFEGVDENDNVSALAHAKRMRSLTMLPGGPTVLVLCHPTKSGTDLLPRGGGAFLNEMDGNLTARKSDGAVEVSWTGKLRGVDFAPLHFKLDTVTAARLRDKGGRPMPTVIARVLDEAGKQALKELSTRDEDILLRALYGNPKATYEVLAIAMCWVMGNGKPHKVKVQRACERLARQGLIMKHRRADYWVLTADGQKELNRLDSEAKQVAVTERKTHVTGSPFPGV